MAAPPQPSHRRSRRPRRRWFLALMLLGLSPLTLKLMGIRSSATQQPAHPDAIFVLGGSIAREKAAARLAAQHPQLPVWVSSGTPADYVRHHVFRPANIDDRRLYLDYRAVDTVTNFTSLVGDLQDQAVRSLYLVTSDDHMPRAMAIAEIVFGSRGIKVHPVPVPSGRPVEPWEKVWRDRARALIWLGTGWTGENLRDTQS